MKNGVEVGDVNLAITVHIGSMEITVSTQDDIDDGIHVGDIHLAVMVHVGSQARLRLHLNYLPEIGIPATVGLIGINRPLRHMKRAVGIVTDFPMIQSQTKSISRD